MGLIVNEREIREIEERKYLSLSCLLKGQNE